MLIDEFKVKLIQCFVHTYRRIRYEFLIMNVIEQCIFSKNFTKYLMNFVLNLSMYRIIDEQRIYFLFVVLNETMYLIEISKKSI